MIAHVDPLMLHSCTRFKCRSASPPGGNQVDGLPPAPSMCFVRVVDFLALGSLLLYELELLKGSSAALRVMVFIHAVRLLALGALLGAGGKPSTWLPPGRLADLHLNHTSL